MPRTIQEEEIAELPLRAIVAFATRCARRVQPLADLPSDDPCRGNYLKAVDEAIQLAEKFASGRERLTVARLYSAVTAIPSTWKRAEINNAPRIAAFSAAAAAYAATTWHSTTEVLPEVVSAATNAARVSSLARISLEAARLDLMRLVELDLGSFPELGRPITPSVRGPLGPLWPEGIPDWYIAAVIAQRRPALPRIDLSAVPT